MDAYWTRFPTRYSLLLHHNSSALRQPRPGWGCQSQSLRQLPICVFAFQKGSRGSWQGREASEGGSPKGKWSSEKAPSSGKGWGQQTAAPKGAPSIVSKPKDTTRRKWADKERPKQDQTRPEQASDPSERPRPASSGGRGGRTATAGGRGSGERGASSRDRDLSKRESKRANKETPQRLAKVLANAGIASRRASEDIVTSGVVKVNGHVVLVPQHMVMATIDNITVGGKPLPKSSAKYYFALNKPKGYICTNQGSREEGGRQRLVVDLFQEWLDREWRPRHSHPNAIPPRLFTVGRLDVPTTGLIFVTNDGEWAQKVQHPSSGLTKEYVATFATVPTRKQLEDLAAGCVVEGAYVQPKSVSLAAPDKRNKIRIVIGEGRNREVRILAENAGLDITGLKRVRVGGYKLPNDLGIGEFREMKVASMKRVTDKGAESNPSANPMAGMVV